MRVIENFAGTPLRSFTIECSEEELEGFRQGMLCMESEFHLTRTEDEALEAIERALGH